MKKRTFVKIDEKSPLIPLARRHPIYYLEHSKLVRSGNDVRVLKEDLSGEFILPVASIGALIMGPGTSISAEAARISASRGCLIAVSGGGGAPLYLTSTQHRSPLSRIRQYETVVEHDRRLNAARKLFIARKKLIATFPEFELPEFPNGEFYSSIESLLAAEGAWAKKAYEHTSKKYQISWDGKKAANDSNHPIVLLNHLSYTIADIAILHLGYDPNIGILHGRTRGGGLSYDIADVFKPVLALVPSFEAIRMEKSVGKIKADFLNDIYRFGTIDLCIKLITNLFKE